MHKNRIPKKQPLHVKILVGYILLTVLVVGIIAAVWYEKCVFQEAEQEERAMLEQRCLTNSVFKSLIALLLDSEGATLWNKDDLTAYQKKDKHMSALLDNLRSLYPDSLQQSRIDTMKHLLAEKKMQVLSLAEAPSTANRMDSLLSERLPMLEQSISEHLTVLEQKDEGKNSEKKSFWQWLKPKNKRKLESNSPSGNRSIQNMRDFGNDMQETLADQKRLYRTLADSLKKRNNRLNRHIDRLINDFERDAMFRAEERLERVSSLREQAFSMICAISSVGLLCALMLYAVISRDLKSKEKYNRQREHLICKLQKTNNRNKELMNFRRMLMQTITHELRSPLTAISGNAELLEHDCNENERFRRIEAIRHSSGRMHDMLDSLLNYFRLDSGKESLAIKPFKLNSIVETLDAEFRSLAKAKNLSFILNNKTNEVVLGDKELILRIGSNLLSNAVKFTRSGTITLNTIYRDGTFSLSVEDTGTGMTEEQQERIFAPFERLGNAVTEDGFGLGLSIVANTVKLLNGSIQVESKPGKGSRFTVSMPLSKVEETTEVKKTSDQYSILSYCSVLAIDNNGMLLDMMKEMYRQSGVECDTCMTAGELTDRMRMKEYDILITDLKMPEMNGYELLELLRTSEIGNSQTIPVVAATAAGYVTEEELKGKGFAGVLYKPYSIDELFAVTENCAGQTKTKRLDFSPLLAFGDRRRTLERLISTTQSDMDGVRKAADGNDHEGLDGWVHHLRSSWTLIKAERPLSVLYEAIHKENISEDEVNAAVYAVLAQGGLITDLARKEAEQWEE